MPAGTIDVGQGYCSSNDRQKTEGDRFILNSCIPDRAENQVEESDQPT